MVNRESIEEETMQALLPNKARTPCFNILPKIRKPGNPGRPIVSSCGSPTEGISRFVNYHLNPLVRKIPSYVKDTTNFLLKLQDFDNLPLHMSLLTFDVTSLYTNIPHNKGIEACRAALNSRGILEPPTEDLIHLLRLIQERKNFTFEDEHFVQIHGTVMATQVAQSYANILMGNLENKILQMVEKTPTVW